MFLQGEKKCKNIKKNMAPVWRGCGAPSEQNCFDLLCAGNKFACDRGKCLLGRRKVSKVKRLVIAPPRHFCESKGAATKKKTSLCVWLLFFLYSCPFPTDHLSQRYETRCLSVFALDIPAEVFSSSSELIVIAVSSLIKSQEVNFTPVGSQM